MGATQQLLASYGSSFVGPLDPYETGIAVAYMPFRGFTSYGGACCRVRDTSDDVEQDEIFGADGNAIFPTLTGNGATRWWYDQSGNGINLPQATAAAQPYLTPNVANGYQTVRFDGTNDTMGVEVGPWAEMTVYLVARRIAPTSNGRLLELSSAFDSSLFVDGAGTYKYYAGFPDLISGVGGNSDDWSIIVLKATNTNGFTPYVNGIAGTPFAFLSPANRYFINLCASSAGEYGNFDVAAVMRWDVAHDDTTREAIQNILADKFGISL